MHNLYTVGIYIMAELANHVASINCFMNNLIKWRLNAVIKEKIRHMCFSPFLKTKDKVDKDRDLIAYLVRSYDVESGCFVFPSFSLFLVCQ